MHLTRDQKEQAANWIKEKSRGALLSCFVCGFSKWVVGDHIVVPPTFEGADVCYPLVRLVCENCGHTVFMNAVSCGIAPSKSAP